MKKNNSKATLTKLKVPVKLTVKEISLESPTVISVYNDLNKAKDLLVNMIKVSNIILLSKIVWPILKVTRLQNHFFLKKNVQKIYPTISLKKYQIN